MTETTTSDLIGAIAKGDTVAAGTAFTDIMGAKKDAAYELRKQEFAGNLFNKDPVEVEEPAVTAEPVEEPAAEEE